MTGHHPFRELTKGFSPEQRRRVDAIKRQLLAELAMLEQDREAPEQG